MRISASVFLLLSVGTLIWFTGDTQLAAQQGDAPAQAGVDELAQGPIHEAFAQPATSTVVTSTVVATAPPAPINELPPDQKPDGADVVWIGGYWAWDNNQFLWVSGTWRHLVPGHQWMPGYWHEAQGGWQWVAGYWSPTSQTEVEVLPPPPQTIVESQPPAPSAESQFVPGHWVYVQQRYWWRPGFFVAYRPGWVWVPASYIWTPGGTIFVEGHWDYDLDSRGLLFAPAGFGRDVYLRPGFYYRPRHAVFASLLFDSLFVSLGSHHYYFGNYYDPIYVQAGFQPWVSFRSNRYPDPLFNYYRWNHRNEPNWENNLQVTLRGRQEGNLPRPPRTIVEFQKNPTVKGGQAPIVNVTNINQITINNKNVTLTKLTENQANAIKTNTEQLRKVSTERASGEGKAVANAKGGSVSKFKMPINTAFQSTAQVQTPASPTLPKLQSTAPDTAKVDTKGKGIDTKAKGTDPKLTTDTKAKGTDPKTKITDGKGVPSDTKTKSKTGTTDTKSGTTTTDGKTKGFDSKGGKGTTTDAKGTGAPAKSKSFDPLETKSKGVDTKATFPSDVKKGASPGEGKGAASDTKKLVPLDLKGNGAETKKGAGAVSKATETKSLAPTKTLETKTASPTPIPQKMPPVETKSIVVEKGKGTAPNDVRAEKGNSGKKEEEKGKKTGWLTPNTDDDRLPFADRIAENARAYSQPSVSARRRAIV